jgi:hypothetical protein
MLCAQGTDLCAQKAILCAQGTQKSLKNYWKNNIFCFQVHWSRFSTEDLVKSHWDAPRSAPRTAQDAPRSLQDAPKPPKTTPRQRFWDDFKESLEDVWRIFWKNLPSNLPPQTYNPTKYLFEKDENFAKEHIRITTTRRHAQFEGPVRRLP